jgi:hypothetical protein
MREPNVKCSNCDVEFYKRPGQSRKTGSFCSTHCYAIWRKEAHKKTCEVCAEEFYPKRREQRFCSLVCSASRPRVLKWNGKGKNFKATVRQRLKNEGWNGICMVQGCSYNRTHDIHRLIGGIAGGEYTPGNTFAICPNHHAEVHRGLIELKKIGKGKLISLEK